MIKNDHVLQALIKVFIIKQNGALWEEVWNSTSVASLGKTKLICRSTGPTNPILSKNNNNNNNDNSKNNNNNITKFWPTGSFLIYYFLLFEKKNKK